MSSLKPKKSQTPTTRGEEPKGLPSLFSDPKAAGARLPSARELSRVLSEVEREEPTNLHPVEFDDGTSQYPAARRGRANSAILPDATVKKYTVPEPEVLPDTEEPTQPCVKPAKMQAEDTKPLIRLQEQPANDVSLGASAGPLLKLLAWCYRVLTDVTIKLRRYLESRGAL